ncbi:hypothetical protein Tco_0987993 [Tanacetum coccineum]|uniref:Uncharacterized protein n=1 Tax=Tanacetum coccineum TaxID=301880 RepID=A0ABQ5EPQ4_9ASTR
MDELRLHLTIAPDEEKEVDYEILNRKYPIKEWKTECLGTKPQTDQAEHIEEIDQNVVIRSNGQKRYFSTLMRVLSIFDREDLNAVLSTDDENEFWNSQLDWIIVSWKLHSSLGWILNGDGPIQVTIDEKGVKTKVPPKTAQALLQRQRERKAKGILLLVIPDEYQLRFHAIKDAKTLWATIKKGLDKAYDRFQKLISLLEVHGAAVSNEDANQKFLRALPSSWNNVALIMRNKDGIDDLDIDDLYNNLKVFEADIKGSSGSSSNYQNVAFLSAKDTSSSNEVNTTNGVSTASGHNSQGQACSSSYIDDLMFSFFANQSNSPQLDDEDLEQIDHDDLEEMDRLMAVGHAL